MFPQTICNYIEDTMINDVKNGAYNDAVTTMFNELNKVYDGELTTDLVADDNIFEKKLQGKLPAMILAVCISFILSAIITLITVKIGKRGYKSPFPQTTNLHPIPSKNMMCIFVQ